MNEDKISNKWEDLEIFTSKGARVKDVRVTITKESAILFNAGLCHRALLNKQTHVKIAYSAQNKAIAFKFTTDANDKGALKLVQRGGSATVGTRSFFTYNQLDINGIAGHYEPVSEDIPQLGEAWVIRLDKKLPGNQ
jgi:hypothetical protein